MLESRFIKENEGSWQELESMLAAEHYNPDRIQELFVKVSGDLSYVRSFFPNRMVRKYLNGLLRQVFDKMRSKQKHRFLAKVKYYYLYTLPSAIIKNWKAFLYAFLLFAVCSAIGAFSLLEDANFAKEILGDSYVSMTEANINEGDPMKVYKDANRSGMFMGITLNNIKVAFLAYVLGIFVTLGTSYVLIKNGIMLGVFQTFFYTKGLLATSFLTIWIHGTIEIASIIVAGAAGIVLGNGILFPGTYSRSVSLREAAVRSLIILLSTVPLFVIAGFLEGYVTRQTDLPTMVKLGIIGGSLTLILLIYVIHPLNYWRKGKYKPNRVEIESENDEISFTIHQTFRRSLAEYKSKLGSVFLHAIFPVVGILGAVVYFLFKDTTLLVGAWGGNVLTYKDMLTPPYMILVLFSIMLLLMQMGNILYNDRSNIRQLANKFFRYFVPLLIMACVLLIPLFALDNFWFTLLSYLVVPILSFAKSLEQMATTDEYSIKSFIFDLPAHFTFFLHSLGFNCLFLFFLLLALVLSYTSLSFLMQDMIGLQPIMENDYLQQLLIGFVFRFVLVSILLGLFLKLYANLIKKVNMLADSTDLKEMLENFNSPKKRRV